MALRDGEEGRVDRLGLWGDAGGGEGLFLGGGQVLGLGQPAVSKLIAQREARLESPLLPRSTLT